MNDPSRKIVCLQAHLSGSVIYVYDSMGVRGLGRAIFKFISTITFKGIPHKNTYFETILVQCHISTPP